MPTFIAHANIQQDFPFDDIPSHLIPDNLIANKIGEGRIQQRHQCRRLAHFLLWQLLKISGKSTALLAEISRTESGRPQFIDDNIDFNISHSGDWVAVILGVNETGKSAVGIDIEFAKQRDYSALLNHFAPPAEVTWFNQQSNAELAFYRCWCLREAVLKSQGVGIAKLSEVLHSAESLHIQSTHCPRGKLIFSAELPFYFAVFTDEQLSKNLLFYQWNGNQLERQELKEKTSYQVN